jgi:Cupin
MRKQFIRVVACGVIAAGLATATAAVAPRGSLDFVRVVPAQIHWEDIPNGHGAQQAILLGDPGKPGMYVVRVKFPPHIMDLPHWHPMARYVTVLEGTWFSGTGDPFNFAQAVPLKPGSVMLHPAKGIHWDGSGSDETVIVQVVGEGPATTTAMDSSKPLWIEVPH